MENKEAKELLIKYKVGICTDEELAMLESWYLNFEDEATNLISEDVIEAKAKVWVGLPVHTRIGKAVRLWRRIAVAASVVVCMTVSLVYYQSTKDQAVNDLPSLATIVPGGNKAVLTLADGSKIDLNNVSKGTLANQSGITITKAADGQLVYTVVESKGKEHAQFNTIETPRGGYYQISLPDGTKVWLNASSSLTYPTSFVAGERKVNLKGEAYFEVAHDKEAPFKVASNNQVITVLGTHFNVSAYTDENRTVTTLLQGKVKVQLNDMDAYAELNPGEQSILVNRTFKVGKVENDDAIAWKNNVFVFDNEELGSIMRKISRWYDVDVVCPPEMEKMPFAGTVSRNKNIEQALRIMELTGTVHFKVEGRRITVMP
ncbi:FecR family protein [Pedobacter nyackensis]|uniref:FecR family protein n=1 Tax=Pedobacter nyackensis TaxID=475255 RepID=A0A1W2BC17_9SPHI|nr:FecR family protein [Pedobacter nyackensis]SMC70449.1 FecR family protein [Pedobacter nyackensis]